MIMHISVFLCKRFPAAGLGRRPRPCRAPGNERVSGSVIFGEPAWGGQVADGMMGDARKETPDGRWPTALPGLPCADCPDRGGGRRRRGGLRLSRIGSG